MITEGDKIVLIKDKEDAYIIAGGHIDYGEDLFESTTRECREETGYKVRIIDRLGFVEIWKKEYKRIIFGFLVRTIGLPGSLLLTEEEKELGYEIFEYSIDDAIKLLEVNASKNNSSIVLRSLMFLKEAKNIYKF